MLIAPHAFIQGNRPDGGGRAEITAGDAGVLAAAGADSEVQLWRPQSLEAALETGRMQDIGGADPHAGGALDAAGAEDGVNPISCMA